MIGKYVLSIVQRLLPSYFVIDMAVVDDPAVIRIYLGEHNRYYVWVGDIDESVLVSEEATECRVRELLCNYDDLRLVISGHHPG